MTHCVNDAAPDPTSGLFGVGRGGGIAIDELLPSTLDATQCRNWLRQEVNGRQRRKRSVIGSSDTKQFLDAAATRDAVRTRGINYQRNLKEFSKKTIMKIPQKYSFHGIPSKRFDTVLLPSLEFINIEYLHPHFISRFKP